MSVPAYGDLGKDARDVLRAGYAYKLANFKLCASRGKFGLDGFASLDLKDFKSSLMISGKRNTSEYGDFSAKYSVSGPFVAEYCLSSIIAENVDVLAGYSFDRTDSFHSGKIAAKYHSALLHTTGSVTKDSDRSLDLLGSVVMKMGQCLMGYQLGYDTNTSRFTKNDVTFGCEHENTAFHLRCIQIPREFGLSAFYKVNDRVDVAMDAKTASDEDTRLWYLAAGFGWKLDDQSKLRMKLDKNLQLGTSMQLRMQNSFLLTLAFSLDLTQPTNGRHKIGLGLEVQA